MRTTWVFAIAGLTLPLAASRVSAEDFDTAELYAKSIKSVAFIVNGDKGSRGSGSLIDADKKLVITNHHVVGDSDDVYVQFPMYDKKGDIITKIETYMDRIPAGLAISGKVLYRDLQRDLAIVEVAKVPLGTPALPLVKNQVKVGSEVYNLGSPGAVLQLFSITSGVVRSVGPKKFLVGGPGSKPFEVNAIMIQATNPANPGDSGGPLVNQKGYQVGVTQSGSRTAQQVNNFVDMTEVRSFLKQKGITIKELSDEPDPKEVERKKEIALKTPKAADPEKEAAALLASSKIFASGEDNREDYKRKLNEVLKKYPDTAAAKEAKKLLEGLK
jgi:S1-C subfamily serine protease